MSQKSELKRITMETPTILPKESNQSVIFYLHNEEELYQAIWDVCIKYSVSIGRWDPYYEDHREDFEKFKHEFDWANDVIVSLCENGKRTVRGLLKDNFKNGPDWFIFQHYYETENHWSDNREQFEPYRHDYILVIKLSIVKEQAEKFFVALL